MDSLFQQYLEVIDERQIFPAKQFGDRMEKMGYVVDSFDLEGEQRSCFFTDPDIFRPNSAIVTITYPELRRNKIKLLGHGCSICMSDIDEKCLECGGVKGYTPMDDTGPEYSPEDLVGEWPEWLCFCHQFMPYPRMHYGCELHELDKKAARELQEEREKVEEPAETWDTVPFSVFQR